MRTLGPLLCFASLARVVPANPLPPTANNTASLNKRTCSVYATNKGKGTWPPRQIYRRDVNEQPIRYCWSTPEAKEWLAPTLAAAISKWHTAMRHTSLSILVDPRAEPSGLCSRISKGDRDALEIRLSHNMDEGGSVSSMGYQHESTRPGRHYIRFLQREQYPHEAAIHYYVQAMAHELGHVMGLAHEHQRADRNNFIELDGTKMTGSATVLSKIRASSYTQLKQSHLSDRQKLDMVLSSYELTWDLWGDMASSYAALDPADATNDYYSNPHAYDYDSIMAYDAYCPSHVKVFDPTLPKYDPAQFSDPEKWAIYRRQRDPQGNIVPIWRGGHLDFKDKVPSAMDAARIEELYPLHGYPFPDHLHQGQADFRASSNQQGGASGPGGEFGDAVQEPDG